MCCNQNHGIMTNVIKRYVCYTYIFYIQLKVWCYTLISIPFYAVPLGVKENGKNLQKPGYNEQCYEEVCL